MKLFTKQFLFFLLIFNIKSIHAQTVVQSWATLTSGSNPFGITIDNSGNVYVTNQNISTVSKITATGTLTQTWGALASNAYPRGITKDASGNIYTANYSNSSISKITASGTVTQAWASIGLNNAPRAIKVDASGNVFTSNGAGATCNISKVTAAGVTTQIFATLNSSSFPYDLAIDNAGNIYTANAGNNTISKITSAGVVTEAWATLATGSSIYSLTFDGSGNIYTANAGNNTISKITPAGVVTTVWASLPSGSGPQYIICDAYDNLYTANASSTISKITPAGVVTSAWATLASGANPRCLAIDASGNIFSANIGNSTVSKIINTLSPPGNALHFDGVNDYVSTTIANNNPQNFTISAWFRTTVAQGGIIGFAENQTGDWSTASCDRVISMNTNGTLNFYVYNGGAKNISSPLAYNDGKYHHVAASISSTNGMRLYVDGALVASNATVTAAQNFLGYWRINYSPGSAGSWFNGNIDQVRIYNTELTLADIQTEMFSTSTSSTGLMYYYNFDQGFANSSNTGVTTLTEIKGGTNNGTLNNFTLGGTTSNWVESYAMVVPTATAATNITTNSFTANWNAPSYGVVENYILDVSTTSNFATAISGSPFTVSGTSYNVTGLVAGPYYYRVRCSKASVTGQGMYSNTITMAALPVVLSSFYVEKQNNTVALKWTTASEINNSHFEIQKSINGTEFNAIGNIESKGNSSATNNYSFVDVKPNEGINFYRLKQVDKNGKTSFSEIRKIDFSSKFSSINIYPNPIIDGKLNIDVGEDINEAINYSISDLQGKIIKKGMIINRQQTISVNEFISGAYVLKIGQSISKIILKK